MSTACTRFRAELEDALAGGRERLARLGDDAHASACADCRTLWQGERGLERILARLPAPQAPAGLALRVLARLAHERSAGPAAFSEGDELEELLASVPAPATPAGLSGRVLAGLAPARPLPGRRGRRPWVLAAAGLLLIGFAWWNWAPRRASVADTPLVSEPASGAELEGDEELLAYAVERWELLHDEDLDVWLASLDPVDELLMEYDDLLVQDADGGVQGASAPAQEGD